MIAFAPSAVIGSLTLSLGDDAPNAGVPAAVRVTVNAFDDDGNKIESAGFTEPIALSVHETIPSGTLSLSTSAIQGPGDSVTLAYSGGTLTQASIVASAGPSVRAVAVFHPTPTFYEVARLMEGAQPEAIAAGPDGNMWVTEQHAIARITPAGDVTEFPLPPELSYPAGIIAASDGRLWFTSSFKSALGAMTTDGSATVYPLPTSTIGQVLVDRGDGTIWYTGVLAYVVGSLEIAGSASTVTYIPSTNTTPDGIAVGPDNQLYFTESGDRASKIGRINAIGDPISEVLFGANVNVGLIVRGPDNNMWFTEVDASKIGRLDPVAFTVTGEFPTLTADAFPTWITVGSDGALWFTEYAVSRIGRITTDGTVQEFVSPVPDLRPDALASAPDGSLWFCEIARGAVGRFVY